MAFEWVEPKVGQKAEMTVDRLASSLAVPMAAQKGLEKVEQ